MAQTESGAGKQSRPKHARHVSALKARSCQGGDRKAVLAFLDMRASLIEAMAVWIRQDEEIARNELAGFCRELVTERIQAQRAGRE
jgi:hypothetical protein